jgi:hypothetical protein
MATLRLTELQQDVLRTVARYRVMTAEALQPLFYADAPVGSARKLLSRLEDQALLQAPHALASRKFYQLTRKGTALVSAPENAAAPLGPQALIDRYGMLVFCCLLEHPPGSRRPVRLTPAEFAAVNPRIAAQPGIEPASQHYYLDATGGRERLARVVVDHNAQTASLARKCRQIYRQWEENGVLATLLPNNFMLTVLTASEPKARDLRRLLLDPSRQGQQGHRFRVEVVPQLLHLPHVERATDG